MAESQTTVLESASSPRHFVAFVRLIGGLLITTGGGIALHYSNGPEITTFACVATVSGVVVNLWGFVQTVLHPKTTREDCFWAIAFMLLLSASLAGNVYFNSFDYGVPFVGLEVGIIGAAVVLGWVVAIVARLLCHQNTILSIQQRRRRMLIAGLVALLLAWLLIRPPLTAQYHVRTLLSGFYGARIVYPVDETIIEVLKKQPKWCVRWALLDGLNNSNLLKVDRTLVLLNRSRVLLMLIEPGELLQVEQKTHEHKNLRDRARMLYDVRINNFARND